MLACNGAGQTVGSLSGGCVEDDLIERLQTGALAIGKPKYMEFGLQQADTESLGLPCGGLLAIVVEPIAASKENLDHFALLIEKLGKRQCMLRTLDMAAGRASLASANRSLKLKYDTAEVAVLQHWYGPQYQLFIIGAGMVSMYLADMALKLDYSVIVCDPRPELLAAWQLEGTRNINMYPDDAIREHVQDSMTAVVALTHDPRIDDMGIMEALTTDAFYVGAMGSSKTSANRRQRLKDLDITDAQLRKLRAPVGLPIGSKAPPEIALSVLADITAEKNKRENEQKKSAQ